MHLDVSELYWGMINFHSSRCYQRSLPTFSILLDQEVIRHVSVLVSPVINGLGRKTIAYSERWLVIYQKLR
jgi:hypothetical protein